MPPPPLKPPLLVEGQAHAQAGRSCHQGLLLLGLAALQLHSVPLGGREAKSAVGVQSQLQLARIIALPPQGIAHLVPGLLDVRERHGTGRGIEGRRLSLEIDYLFR